MACTEPSLPGAFNILGTVGQDKLLRLKHKLKTLHLSCQGAGLLRAMVLLTLGQDTEARLSLEMLRTDSAARFVAHQWAGMDVPEAPEEPPDMSWTVARVYHLLAEEKLCPVSLREAAYHAALQAFSSMDDPRLPELQAEARDRCGWDVSDLGDFQCLRSDLGTLPPPSASPLGTRSLPQPIKVPSGWSRACSLRSSGSPASLASNLEISQSPTVPYLTQPRSPPGPSKLCGKPWASPRPEPAPVGHQEPEQVSWPPSVETDPPQEPPLSAVPQLPVVDPDPSPAGPPDPSAPPESRAHYPVECTEMSAAPQSSPSPPQSLPSPPDPQATNNPTKDGTPLPLSVEDTASQKTKSCPPPPPAPQRSPPSPSPSPSPQCAAAPPSSSDPSPPELESSEQKFYNFVVLHARADEHVALRVRERLEELGVPDGATFCEDFQVPGRGELTCLQDAIDHSAFTILLLTPNFDCRLSMHQVSQALMNSFGRPGWLDSVIPFRPLETSQLSSDTSRLLSSLVYLDEHSQLFNRKVKNTFKKQTLQERKANWKREQETRAIREQSQRLEGERQQLADMNAAYSAYMHSYVAWQAQMEQLHMAFGTQMSLGTHMPPRAHMPSGGQVPVGLQPPMPTWPAYPQPPLPPGLAGNPPAFTQRPSFLPASPAAPPSPGLQPLIIHHAQMVQLGLNNHMWGQRGTQAPEDKTQEAE
ncbi:TIR domain-containing adapter molecule 1 [Orycteropus afer afer]|uniref:TIR domain-containing adapter molecule 1 n=1 Tax=Orycteropus afer afer TaxID=1230840 RepID=A0AC54ZCV1_ORYAF|nr:TIR domain-containing adapter molecule 1 [Orycteropus afer afer]